MIEATTVALQLYREGSADFADCLHVALAAQSGELLPLLHNEMILVLRAFLP